ncbi:cytochrome c biogenesis CcdA family protein [Oceanibaculum nanhaiense]|uniref:cytochrome c biogenesis CcdA family protein n=1 Tax=Oceanibaculum TaxID=659693 RepID=UPI003898FBCE
MDRRPARRLPFCHGVPGNLSKGRDPRPSGIGLTAPFLAGAVSFVSPCVLPLMPGYVAGHTAGAIDIESAHRRRQALSMGLYFVVGFSTIGSWRERDRARLDAVELPVRAQFRWRRHCHPV